MAPKDGGKNAGKDGGKEGEGYEFSVPDFDEDAFIHKEMVSFRTTSVLFIVGLLAALISWAIYEAMDAARAAWFVGLAIMAFSAYILRFLYPALKIDVRHFGRREWFGTFFLIFFAWLAFFILFLNPPISDHAEPTATVFFSPSTQVVGGDVAIDLFVADNHRIDNWEFHFERNGITLMEEDDLAMVAPGHYSGMLENIAAGAYSYSVNATDAKGNSNGTVGELTVIAELAVDLPADGTLDGTDTILVSIPSMARCANLEIFDGGDCLRAVYLQLANGQQVHLEFTDTFGGWLATSNYAGWSAGNNSFDVVAEQANRFFGATLVPGGEIRSDGHSVVVPAAGGSYEAEKLPEVEIAPVTRQTPGIGALATVVILIGGVALARRSRQQD